jgi:hypothetical protein
VGRPAAERFWSKVDASGVCWEWTAAKTNGYGRFGVGQRTVQAHRWAWESLVGPISAGFELDHLCRNPACVMPDHLQPVRHAENVQRGAGGWNKASLTHCPRGHPYAGKNLLVNRAGGRVCRICKRARQRARYQPRPRIKAPTCPSGHAFTAENTGLTSKGYRYCRECSRQRCRARYQQTKAR